jgi:hypothetical protein
MKKIIIILISCLTSATTINAQSKNSNTVFFEVGGPGLASFNYDTRFTKSSSGWGGRIGIGGFGGKNDLGVLTIPIGINFLASGDDKHFFEAGINQTFLSVKENIFGENNSSSSTFTTLNFGYRSQPKGQGFVFKASVNPIFSNGYFFPFYFGVGFGYKF